MRERQLPPPMRMMLRDYFASARRVHEANDDGELLDKLTPLLQGTVALAANKKWLDHVWYFRKLEDIEEGSEFIALLAKQLVVRAFVASERLPVGQLYILRKGFCVKMWRFLRSGKVWGEDMILETPELIDHSQAVALTYVEAYTLRKRDLMSKVKDFPEAARIIRRAMRRMTLQRALLKYLCMATGKEKGPASFAPRSQAKGYTFVPDIPSLEQKVEGLVEANDRLEVHIIEAKKTVRDEKRLPGGALVEVDGKIGHDPWAYKPGDGSADHSAVSASIAAPQPTVRTGPSLPQPERMPPPATDAPPAAKLKEVLDVMAGHGKALSAQCNVTAGQAERLERLERGMAELKEMVGSVLLLVQQQPQQQYLAPPDAMAVTEKPAAPASCKVSESLAPVASAAVVGVRASSPSHSPTRTILSSRGSADSPRVTVSCPISPRSVGGDSNAGSHVGSSVSATMQLQAIARVASASEEERHTQEYWANRLGALRGFGPR